MCPRWEVIHTMSLIHYIHVSCDMCREVAKVIIDRPDVWKDAMKAWTVDHKNVVNTPLRRMIKRMPGRANSSTHTHFFTKIIQTVLQ